MLYDVVTLGETMLRLTPPGQQLIEQTRSFEVYIGGSESNVAVGLSRLGWKTAWLSRLPDNPLSRLITYTLASQGVDVSHVTWTDSGRLGVYYIEEGPLPRGSRAIYDRAGSAMSYMRPDDLPDGLFIPGRSRFLLVSGITLAIGETAAQTAKEAARRAKSAGWQVCFDVNHRANLWTVTTAAEQCDPLLDLANVIFVALRDAVTLYGSPPTADDAIRHIAEQYPDKLIVMTLGAEGAISITATGEILRQSIYPAQGAGRVGGGDAFAAGFLSGYMETESVSAAMQWGAASAAYKYTIPGDMPLLDRRQIQNIIASNGSSSIQR
jgi:2-dehydro-3-deoxygluconokinase